MSLLERIPYLLPPKDTCWMCGRSLWGQPRYKVWLIVKEGGRIKRVCGIPLVYRAVVVCESCWRKILGDERVRERFRVKYRKLKTLRLD